MPEEKSAAQELTDQRIFGPVPSRRLGRSLGVNNIPPKICTYACVYCQLGNAIGMTNHRKSFYDPEDLALEVTAKVQEIRSNQDILDYLTIVPDGEPTLDQNLGQLLDLLKPLGVKLAVISNASLIHIPQVKADLMLADWVSLKVDSTEENIWRAVDRPHGRIRLDQILEGIESFASEYHGNLVTETMLVQDINDGAANIKNIASFLRRIKPSTAYLGIPTRPPAEKYVNPPSEENLNQAFQIFLEAELDVEYLIGYEGNEFSSTGDIEKDLLSITSVHPMREDAVAALFSKAGSDLSILDKLIKEEKLACSSYQGHRYYIRKFKRHKPQ